MFRLIIVTCLLSLFLVSPAQTILVRNLAELNEAGKRAGPGTTIMLQNGTWKDIVIKLDANGSKDKPVIYKAQTAGKVLISGQSQLKIGGSHIRVEGLYFTDGYAGDEPVIAFRSGKDKPARNCRVTNCVINDFNNPRRMDENYWVAFYGKDNRLDHCSFFDKKNMGVLLAVILDSEESRENFHSIDHNYFGRRPPLASNGGEIIRVGVSQHAQYRSNTTISNNFFDQCDGETEIISIKSCSNTIRDNVLKECQGAIVLRHGDNNLVSGNLVLGNDKPGTGGVRIINKGQKVKDNLFYKCRGLDFRAPMAIMNGIPNSPAHRYVQVSDAEISGNLFYESAPVTFGEGSDAERTLPPDNVVFNGNTFYNSRDSIIYKAYDNIKGIHFNNNKVSKNLAQVLVTGFEKTLVRPSLSTAISGSPVSNISQREKQTLANSGAAWFAKKSPNTRVSYPVVVCKTARDIYNVLEKKRPAEIQLSGNDYIFHKSLQVEAPLRIKTNAKEFINLHTVPRLETLFEIKENGSLVLENLKLDGSDVKSTHFIASDSSGPSEHYSLVISHCDFRYFNRNYGCENIFYAYPSTLADSIVLANSNFENNYTNVLLLSGEKTDKGYYNAEKLRIQKNNFTNQKGMVLDLYRGGNDESTLGPGLLIQDNYFSNCHTEGSQPLISLTGVQHSRLLYNSFVDCNTGKTLLFYKDIVRARHKQVKNLLMNSGSMQTNSFVETENNTIQ